MTSFPNAGSIGIRSGQAAESVSAPLAATSIPTSSSSSIGPTGIPNARIPWSIASIGTPSRRSRTASPR